MEFNLIQRGELMSRLSRALIIKERAPAPTLSPEVQAVVILEDLTKESVFAQPTERRCVAGDLNAAVAAERGVIGLYNPVNSGVVAVVDWLNIASDAIDRVSIRRSGNPPSGLTQSSTDWADPRHGDGFPACELWIGTDPALIGSQLFLVKLGTTTWIGSTFGSGPELVLPPGSFLIVEALAVNTVISASFSWLETTS